MYKNFIYCLLLLALIACQSIDQSQNNSQTIPTKIESSPEQYNVDLNSSIATWLLKNEDKLYDGIMPVDSGFLQIDPNNLLTGKINLDLTGLSIKTQISKNELVSDILDLVNSPQYFDASRYPLIAFEFADIPMDSLLTETVKQEADTDNSSDFLTSIRLIGTATVKNVQAPFDIPSKIRFSNQQISIESRFYLNTVTWEIQSIVAENDTSTGIPDQVIQLGLYIEAHHVSK